MAKTIERETIDIPDMGTIRELLAECYEQANGDIDEAVVLLLAETDPDARLEESLTVWREIRRSAIAQLMRQHAARLRTQVWNGVTIQREAKPDRNVADGGLALLAERNLYDFPLMDGTPVGDATGRQLDATIEMYAIKLAGIGRRHYWLSKVREVTPDDRRVREVLSLADLNQIHAEATKAIAS